MKRPFDPERREFFKVTSIAGAGFLLGFHLPLDGKLAAFAQSRQSTFAPNAWLRIDGDGTVAVTVAKSEMGQGSLRRSR